MEPDAYHEMFALETQHWWYRGMREISEKMLLAALGDRRDLQILDAGCGTGINLKALGRFGEVTGFDYSALALAYAGRDHAGKLARASIEKLPFATNSFDLVTSFDVIYCAEVRDDVQAIRDMGRVVRSGGHVLIRVPALPALKGAHDVFVHGIRRYTARELDQKLRSAGLSPLKLSYANSLLLPLIYPARKWQTLRSDQGNSDVQHTLPLISSILFGVLKLESWWINGGHHFPAGVSLFALARKD